MTPLAMALRLLRFGYGPVPIKDKRPLVKWRDFHLLRKVTEADVREWWGQHPDASIALLTGWQYDLVVVDSDNELAEAWCRTHLPDTPRMVRTRRGWHRYYRHPGLETRSKTYEVAPHTLLDVKGDRAQCTAPGSIHPSGHRYRATRRWSAEDRIPLLPKVVVVVACISPAPPRRLPREESSTWNVDEETRLGQYLTKHPLPEVGCGSDRATFNAAVFALMVGVSEDAFVRIIVGQTGWDDRWVASKYRSAARRAS